MMSSRWSLAWAFGLCGLVLGCSSARDTRLADGSWHIRCDEAMHRCTNRAEILCGDRGYRVVGGGTQSKVLGAPNSSYRARTGEAELVVRCGEEPGLASVPLAEEPPPVAPSAGAACVPGATQTCVGPGGCSGGQACLPDGSGFDLCDCGDRSPPGKAEEEAPPVTPNGPAESGEVAPSGAEL